VSLPSRDFKLATGEARHPFVYVIDGDTEVRRSLHHEISTYGFISWPFASPSDFLENLPTLQPAPIMVEVGMGPISGLQLLRIIYERGIRWPVIAMAGHTDIRTAVQAIKLGAIDILEKPLEFEVLKTSLQAAMAQLSDIKKEAEIRDGSHRLFDSLSTREVEVMMACMDGLSNKLAAYRLSLSVRTIEMHRANALLKLKVKSIAEVVQLARAAGITLTARK